MCFDFSTEHRQRHCRRGEGPFYSTICAKNGQAWAKLPCWFRKIRLSASANNGLADMLRIGFAAVNGDFKDFFFHFINDILANMPYRDALDGLVDQNADRWSKKPSSMNNFVRRVLSFKPFTKPVAFSLKKHRDDEVVECDALPFKIRIKLRRELKQLPHRCYETVLLATNLELQHMLE